MSEREWVVVDEVSADGQAEILRGWLEAQGITVWLNQEGAGKAIGITLPRLGRVQILVPSDQSDNASELLEAYYSNTLDIDENVTDDIDDDITQGEMD
jgi:hypothetical protein